MFSGAEIVHFGRFDPHVDPNQLFAGVKTRLLYVVTRGRRRLAPPSARHARGVSPLLSSVAPGMSAKPSERPRKKERIMTTHVLPTLKWKYDHGGRYAAGFRPRGVGDCVTRSIAIATGLPYATVADMVNEMG